MRAQGFNIALWGVLVLGLIGAMPANPAWAVPSGTRAEVVEALNAWDLAGAARALESLNDGAEMDPVTLLLTGRLRLMQGRYTEASDQLQQAVAMGAGGTAEHFLKLAMATAAETADYEHHTTASGRFIISHAPGPDAVLVPYAEDVLERAYDVFSERFDFKPPTPIRVEFYPRVEVLGAVSSLTVDEIKTSGTIALCKYARLMVVSPRDLVYGYGWRDTLAHEFIHLIITQKSRNRVPIWLHEGLAKYHESLWREGGVPRMGRRSEDLLARALADDALISFEAMSPSMAKLPSQEASGTAFAEVYMVMEFLERRRQGPEGAHMAGELVALMAAGKSDREAVATVARMTWPRFQPAWTTYLKGRGLKVRDSGFDQKLLFRGGDTEAEELSELKGERARHWTWLGDQMRLRERWKAAAKEYRKATAEVGDDTPIVQAKLGHALLMQGALKLAVAAMAPVVKIYPKYVLLQLYLGQAYLRLGDLENARIHLEEAAGLNPFDPDLHGHLVTTYTRLGMPERAASERAAHKIVRAPRP